MGFSQNEHPQYEMTKSCTCPDGRCVCGKTHFADDDTIAYIAKLEAELALARKALDRIEKWTGFPSTGRYWDEPKNTQPMSYSACYGSNGERDYMRNVATKALSTLTTGNAVQQIEARAYEKAADECLRLWKEEADAAVAGTQEPKYHDAIECAYAIRKLAEQKEKG